ncbi:putative DCC family thiol-disulfide oxidoreductase YuxK [Shimia isoporae]|uniref:Putative DCC family thiol-disulfide oxidoreductase YuxK n=1 Tax=Shimia isoporae TaxID=647720 RepID=A0A4R1NL70_9RHOB|nr:DUF393 domain-containing protein [Shimia isoporae]TCL08855.1 putative DCC family thiol-disulfide oxidoreductase YuxK [Shimia isoporae]
MPSETRVLFNAQCPVCNAEICHYRTYSEKQNLTIRFDDLNSDALSQWGIDAEDAARRLHVAHEGQLFSGVPAFIVLWNEMPRYQWLAKLVGLPIVRTIAAFVYDRALAPALYKRHKRRMAQASSA